MRRGRPAPLYAGPCAVLWLCATAASGQTATPTAPNEAAPEAAVAGETAEIRALEVDFGLEAKVHFRDSERLANPSPFPFPPEFLPPGQTRAFQETVDEGRHFEISTLTLLADAVWGENLAAHAKVDFIDLYDRNPTSSDREIDVDELWIRFGSDPARAPGAFALYARLGKFAHFERQDDRHLESYGLVSTAFNRFEDAGLEVGADLGRHLYLRASLTAGNPLFFRDPNALAGDNGTPAKDPVAHPNPEPELQTGFPILYDAEVEDLDTDGELETGGGIGLRLGDPEGGGYFDLLAWGYRRKLAQTVALEGTSYGGDLDLLDGPFEGFSLPIAGDDKREVGANLRAGAGGFSFFGQYVAQELAGMDRTGWEAEVAWRFELPLAWAVGGRQLFPSLQPAARYSRLEPEFAGGSPQYPAPSVRWEWTKLDLGVRLAIVSGVDLTIEYADNVLTRADGRELSEDELLATLRFRM
ncbi:MAG: hypothetical protein F9K18_13550 [Thermoanaerobaculia bacterium]|nr:MAG: hypothetical protein F9K18_13550 [Thermoanaerobaculia bacterium]